MALPVFHQAHAVRALRRQTRGTNGRVPRWLCPIARVSLSIHWARATPTDAGELFAVNPSVLPGVVPYGPFAVWKLIRIRLHFR